MDFTKLKQIYQENGPAYMESFADGFQQKHNADAYWFNYFIEPYFWRVWKQIYKEIEEQLDFINIDRNAPFTLMVTFEDNLPTGKGTFLTSRTCSTPWVQFVVNDKEKKTLDIYWKKGKVRVTVNDQPLCVIDTTTENPIRFTPISDEECATLLKFKNEIKFSEIQTDISDISKRIQDDTELLWDMFNEHGCYIEKMSVLFENYTDNSQLAAVIKFYPEKDVPSEEEKKRITRFNAEISPLIEDAIEQISTRISADVFEFMEEELLNEKQMEDFLAQALREMSGGRDAREINIPALVQTESLEDLATNEKLISGVYLITFLKDKVTVELVGDVYVKIFNKIHKFPKYDPIEIPTGDGELFEKYENYFEIEGDTGFPPTSKALFEIEDFSYWFKPILNRLDLTYITANLDDGRGITIYF